MLIKSVFFALAYAALGLLYAWLATKLDFFFGLPSFRTPLLATVGAALVLFGLGCRVWASREFFRRQLRVLHLRPQSRLVTTGPYAFSRHPLYVGIVAIAGGAALLFGSPAAVITTVLIFIFWHFYLVLIEEPRLRSAFGAEYEHYCAQTPRWF